MTKIGFLLIAAVLCFWSCKTEQNSNKHATQIECIENGLLPNIVIEGEKSEKFTIYERMRHYNVPGVSIAFFEDGQISWAKGYGFTGFDSLTAVNTTTLFQAASISKPVAALAALSFVDEGIIGLDDNVNNYLKDWQVDENEYTKEEKVTLRRILSHSAGLTVHGFAGYEPEDSIPSVIQILNGTAPANSPKVYPNIKPGEKYRYSGGGYTIMQKLLEDISGKPFAEIMNERVLSKIDMQNSSYIQPLPNEKHKNAALAHRANGKVVKGNWHVYPEMAAAGLWTTPSDLLKYAIEVQKSFEGNSNKVISQALTKEMLTAQASSHGLGPGLSENGDELRFSHGGANEGYRCYFLAFTKANQGVAIMTNSDNGGAIQNELLHAFSETYNWTIYKPTKKILYPMSAEKLNVFVGKYKYTEDNLIVELVNENDHLKGIQHWSTDTFIVFPESELIFFDKDDGASLEFLLNEHAEVKGLIIQKQYKFEKID